MTLDQAKRCGLYLLVFLLPWQTRWIAYDPPLFGDVWEYGRVSVYSWDLVLVALALLSLGALRREFIDLFKTSRAFQAYVLLTAMAFISSWAAPKPYLVSYWGLRLMEGGVLWLLVRAVKPKFEHVLWALALAGSLQAIWGLGQFAFQATFASKWLGVAAHPVETAGTSVLLNEGGRWLRAYAGQVHPNVLGGLLVITMLATTLLLSKTSSRAGRYALVILYILQAGGLFVAFSRAGWLALAVSLVAWWVGEHSLRSSAMHVAIITAAVFVVFGSILWEPTKARLIGAPASRLEQQAVEERVTGIKESQTITKVAWWRGVGLGNYTKALAQRTPGLRAYRYQPVHNLFLLVLAELGVLGLAALVWLFKERFVSSVARAWLWLPPILLPAFFDHYWWTSASMLLLFWLIVSLSDLEHFTSTLPEGT